MAGPALGALAVSVLHRGRMEPGKGTRPTDPGCFAVSGHSSLGHPLGGYPFPSAGGTTAPSAGLSCEVA